MLDQQALKSVTVSSSYKTLHIYRPFPLSIFIEFLINLLLHLFLFSSFFIESKSHLISNVLCHYGMGMHVHIYIYNGQLYKLVWVGKTLISTKLIHEHNNKSRLSTLDNNDTQTFH